MEDCVALTGASEGQNSGVITSEEMTDVNVSANIQY